MASRRRYRRIGLLALALALASTSCARGPLLPDALAGLRAVAPLHSYDRSGLYQLIDGAAEVHIMHGFEHLWTRTYASSSGPLLVELFDEGSAAGAYAAFTHNRDLEGEDVPVGGGGHLLAGSLWFWRGRYVVCLSGRSERPPPPEALRSMARELAQRLPGETSEPELVRRLPADGLRRKTVRYFRAAAALGYHVEELDGRRLGLDGTAEVVVAEYYPSKEGPTLLLLIRYAAEREAQRALAALEEQLRHRRPSATQPASAREHIAGRRGPIIAAVLEARTAASAQQLLHATLLKANSGRAMP